MNKWYNISFFDTILLVKVHTYNSHSILLKNHTLFEYSTVIIILKYYQKETILSACISICRFPVLILQTLKIYCDMSFSTSILLLSFRLFALNLISVADSVFRYSYIKTELVFVINRKFLMLRAICVLTFERCLNLNKNPLIRGCLKCIFSLVLFTLSIQHTSNR